MAPSTTKNLFTSALAGAVLLPELVTLLVVRSGSIRRRRDRRKFLLRMKLRLIYHWNPVKMYILLRR